MAPKSWRGLYFSEEPEPQTDDPVGLDVAPTQQVFSCRSCTPTTRGFGIGKTNSNSSHNWVKTVRIHLDKATNSRCADNHILFLRKLIPLGIISVVHANRAASATSSCLVDGSGDGASARVLADPASVLVRAGWLRLRCARGRCATPNPRFLSRRFGVVRPFSSGAVAFSFGAAFSSAVLLCLWQRR